MKPWPEWKLKLVAGIVDANRTVVVEGQYIVLDRKMLSQHAEEVQLLFKARGCQGAEQHFHLRTPHGVRDQSDLDCFICTANASHNMFKTEVGVIKDLKAHEHGKHMLLGVVCQWAPPSLWGWKGRFDFYHFPSATMIQVDGPPHFVGMRKQKASKLLQHDMDCCVAVWRQSGRLVRVHHEDIEGCATLILQAASRPGSFIALSPRFAYVKWVDGSECHDYEGCLSNLLQCTAHVNDSDDCIWFCQPTL